MYRIINRIFTRLQRLFRIINYFVLPNILVFFNKKVIYKSIPLLEQVLLFNGDGMVEIGNNCSFGYKKGGFNRGGSIELQARYNSSKIKIGDNVATNNNIMICAANYIEIGNDTLIGQYVTIMDHEAHDINPTKRREIGKIGTIIIGKNVWIGNNVIILKDSHIGDNTIVASGAVISGKYPCDIIVGGVPAKIIKSI